METIFCKIRQAKLGLASSLGKDVYMSRNKRDIRNILNDAHAFFYMLKNNGIQRLKLWNITEDSIIVDLPKGAPLRSTVLGYLPTLDGSAIFEIEATASCDEIPEQMKNTIRFILKPENIKRINRRMFPRYIFSSPQKLTIKRQGMKAANGSITNIGAGGMRINTSKKLSVDKAYRFIFELNTSEEIHDVDINGTTAYEIPMEKDFSYGIRFENPEVQNGGETDTQSMDKTINMIQLINKLIVNGDKK